MAYIPTASLLIIGNEILSGRTEDKNIHFLARELTVLGIVVKEVRVVPDKEEKIIEAVNILRHQYDYVFTTGGIGPTHDDITAPSIAKALARKLENNSEAVKRLEAYYSKGQLTEVRLRMARMPEGAVLIDNAVSMAPGFQVENVYIMAGVPHIMQAMFHALKPTLKKGDTIYSREITAMLPESSLAEDFALLQERFEDIDMGSYPFVEGEKYGVSLVLRGYDLKRLVEAEEALKHIVAGKKKSSKMGSGPGQEHN